MRKRKNITLTPNIEPSNEMPPNKIQVTACQTVPLSFGQESENLHGSLSHYLNSSDKKMQVETEMDHEEPQITDRQTYYVLQKFDSDQHTRILRGTFHQSDLRFVELSRGRQGITISVIVLCFFKINQNPATWKSCDVNDILNHGDVQYHASYKQMKIEGKSPQRKYLLLHEVYPYARIGQQFFWIKTNDYFNAKTGILNFRNLENSLNQYFKENTDKHGILTCNIYSFTIIGKSNSFFLFNPRATSYAGEPMNENDEESAACLMEVFTVKCLTNHVIEACNQEYMVFDDADDVTKIYYSLIDVTIEKKSFGKEVLERKRVSRLLNLAGANRGGISRKPKTIPRHLSNHPTIPIKKNVSEAKSISCGNNLSTYQSGGNDNVIPNNSADNSFDVMNEPNEIHIGCGMKNLGNSCFFNACLQAFFHIPCVNIHFQKVNTKNCNCFACNLVAVFKATHTRNNNSTNYDPSKLYRAMQKNNNNLLNYNQQDAHEFWLKLLQTMGRKTNCSAFPKLFEHSVITTVRCDQSSQTKRVSCGHVLDIQGLHNIREAVDAYLKAEIIETYACQHCNIINKNEATKEYILENAPKVLYLVLNRFKNKANKFASHIELDPLLNLQVSKEKAPVRYKLTSIINHNGSDIFQGHYTAVACCSDNSFYEFNDDHVHKIRAPDGCSAYLLMYELSTECINADSLSHYVNVDDLFEAPEGLSEPFIQDTLSEPFIQDTLSEICIEDPDYSIPNNFSKYPSADHQNSGDKGQCFETPHPDSSSDKDHIAHNQEPLKSASQNVDNPEDNARLSGNRIVDIAFLFEQMKYLNKHSDECDSQMVFKKETKLGFRSIFHFTCSECGIFHKVQSSSKNDIQIDVNKAAILGVTSIGAGFYNLEELTSHLNVPCMSSKTFENTQKKMQENWWELGQHSSEIALKEEMEHAIATGSVDSAGNPLITVVCDGSWGKRSYGKGFSSLSGCAVIVGFFTKKVIYYGVKNKYCHVCTMSYANHCPPNDHPCNINYFGPSSGMESEIIVEGFQACERAGARFHKVISDGDSSAFKEIRELCLYKYPDIIVEKLECVNHLYKNARKKIDALSSDTNYCVEHRKLLKPSTGDDLCKGIRMAAKHWRESNIDEMKKLENLERDCLNAPLHHFGNHDQCDKYFCNKKTTEASNAAIDILKSAGLFYAILNYCNTYFASNVKSLLEDCNTNAAEEFNNVAAKYLGGKRINYSLAGSYGARISAAVVHFNSKFHAGSEFHKFFSVDTEKQCLKMENKRIQHYTQNEIARQTKPRKRIKNDKKVKGYGDQHQQLDMPQRSLDLAKGILLDDLKANQVNRDIILQSTIGQKLNTKWLETRKKLVNCSYFGRIISSRSPKSYKKLVYEMIYSEYENGNSAELRHYRLYEKEALKMFQLVYKDFDLEKTGLFIDKEICFLAASPTRLYGPESIVSVRCPVKAYRKTVDESMSARFKKWLPYLKKSNNDIEINLKSSWYAEVQGQLHITGRKFAYLVIWLGEEFTIKKVVVDHSFWKNSMEKKLTFFFNEAMIKELADPRKARRMELREYDPQTKTFE